MTMVKLSTSPLPPPPQEWGHSHSWSDCLRVYKTILDAERHADDQVKASSFVEEPKENRMFARLIGYLLLELFNRREVLSEGPCASIVKQIESTSRRGSAVHDVVFKVGKWHWDYLLRTYRTSTRRYPTPSLHSSQPSINKLTEITKEYVNDDGKDYRTARGKALARDGFRCMLTGIFDNTSIKQSRELDLKSLELGVDSGTAQACHILNEPTMQGIDPTMASEKSTIADKYAAHTMSILRHFGLESLALELLAADGVHNLGNLLSLSPHVHAHFDNLELWFERTDKPNCYTVCVSDIRHEKYLRMHEYLDVDGDRLSITFSSAVEGARLPNSQLLALHAACARVAHMCGATEAMDELQRDVEDTRVLAFDGSSARLLDHLMSPFASIPGVT